MGSSIRCGFGCATIVFTRRWIAEQVSLDQASVWVVWSKRVHFATCGETWLSGTRVGCDRVARNVRCIADTEVEEILGRAFRDQFVGPKT